MSNDKIISTETKKLTREEFENSLKSEKNAPEDVAAAFFTMEYPRYRAMLDELSMNELIRLNLNLAGGEYVPEQNRLKTEKEKSAFYLGNQMVQNRAIMQLTFEMQKAEEAYQKEQEELKNKETTNPKQGE